MSLCSYKYRLLLVYVSIGMISVLLLRRMTIGLNNNCMPHAGKYGLRFEAGHVNPPSQTKTSAARDATARDAAARDAAAKDTTVVVCTQQQRLEQIARMCDRYEGTHATRASTISTIDSMTDEEIITRAENWYVIPELKIMGCLNWKTGSHTWRIVFMRNYEQLRKEAEANENQIINEQPEHLTDYPVSEIREMLKTYWKFMTIRHPLSRLVSAYKDKVAGKSDYALYLDLHVRSHLREHNMTDDHKMRGSTFKEFLQYINTGGKDMMMPDDGGHWHSLLSRCLPCAISIDHVVRTETFEEDAPYIIDHRLLGIGKGTKLHLSDYSRAQETSSWETILDEYQEIPTDLLAAMGKRYEKDMAVYGYNYTRLAGGQVRAECATLTNEGHTCC